jgi:hypothetical protein
VGYWDKRGRKKKERGEGEKRGEEKELEGSLLLFSLTFQRWLWSNPLVLSTLQS